MLRPSAGSEAVLVGKVFADEEWKMEFFLLQFAFEEMALKFNDAFEESTRVTYKSTSFYFPVGLGAPLAPLPTRGGAPGWAEVAEEKWAPCTWRAHRVSLGCGFLTLAALAGCLGKWKMRAHSLETSRGKLKT